MVAGGPQRPLQVTEVVDVLLSVDFVVGDGMVEIEIRRHSVKNRPFGGEGELPRRRLGCVSWTGELYRRTIRFLKRKVPLMNTFFQHGKCHRRWNLLALPAFVLFCLPGITSQADQPSGEPSVSEANDSRDTQPKEQVATLAGGCFWCTEAVFERMQGVSDVVSGYIGGHVPDPTYQQVCTKTTGHAEAVQVYYDPSVTTYEELLEVFFKTHDPTTLNRQGADVGPQYRSAVFYHDPQQKQVAENYIKKLDQSGEFNSPIVTKLEKATTFYPAEEYHQDYYRKNPNAGYCQVVVRNKVRKFNRTFGDKIKKD